MDGIETLIFGVKMAALFGAMGSAHGLMFYFFLKLWDGNE